MFSGVKYAQQSAFKSHADLTGRAAGSKAVDVLVMVEIDMGTSSVKTGLSFDVAVQSYTWCRMSVDELFPGDDDPG